VPEENEVDTVISVLAMSLLDGSTPSEVNPIRAADVWEPTKRTISCDWVRPSPISEYPAAVPYYTKGKHRPRQK